MALHNVLVGVDIVRLHFGAVVTRRTVKVRDLEAESL